MHEIAGRNAPNTRIPHANRKTRFSLRSQHKNNPRFFKFTKQVMMMSDDDNNNNKTTRQSLLNNNNISPNDTSSTATISISTDNGTTTTSSAEHQQLLSPLPQLDAKQQQQQLYGPKASNVRDYIIEAVALAHQAVQEDTDNEPDLERARRLYRECAQRLEHIKPFVPDEHAKVLNRFSKIYRERAHTIKETLEATNSSSSATTTALNDETREATTTSSPDTPNSRSAATRRAANPSQMLSAIPDTSSANAADAPFNSTGMNNTNQSGMASSSLTANNNNNNNINNNRFVPPSFTIQFEEESLPQTPDMQPPEWVHRPFWLMMTLQQTMMSGGHLTPGLYVPKSVWFQPGAKLMAQHAKMTFCSNLSTFLQELSVVDLNNTKLLLESLDSFIERAEKEKSTLAKQLPSNTHGSSAAAMSDKKLSNELYSNTTTSSTGKYLSGKLFGLGKSLYKSVSGVVASQKKEETGENQYVPWLISIFQQSQFLDHWLTHFEKSGGPKAVIDRLEKISFFFYFVICQFVLQDLNILLDRYMRKSRESFSRLFPKDHKPAM